MSRTGPQDNIVDYLSALEKRVKAIETGTTKIRPHEKWLPPAGGGGGGVVDEGIVLLPVADALWGVGSTAYYSEPFAIKLGETPIGNFRYMALVLDKVNLDAGEPDPGTFGMWREESSSADHWDVRVLAPTTSAEYFNQYLTGLTAIMSHFTLSIDPGLPVSFPVFPFGGDAATIGWRAVIKKTIWDDVYADGIQHHTFHIEGFAGVA